MNQEFRKFVRRLRDNGYVRVRITGSHYIYRNKEGNAIAVNKDLNKMVERRLIRENNLI